jgi:hypothetical protein
LAILFLLFGYEHHNSIHAEHNNQKGKAASAAASVLGPQNKIPCQETHKLKSGNYPKITHKALTQ